MAKNKSSNMAFRKPRGFTLIELLVVIAIIVLLVSILVPSLKKAKEMARLSLCVSRLREQGSGMLAYASDHGMLMPFRPGWRGAGSGLDAQSWEWLMAPYVGAGSERADWTDKTTSPNIQYTYNGKTYSSPYVDVHYGVDNTPNPIFWCPSAPITGKRGWGLYYESGWGQANGYQGSLYEHHLYGQLISSPDGNPTNMWGLITGDPGFFPAIARIRTTYWSSPSATPRLFCSCVKFGADNGCTGGGNLYDQHTSWHNRNGDFRRPAMFMDGRAQILTSDVCTSGFENPLISTSDKLYRYLRTGPYNGYELTTGNAYSGQAPHRPWDFWLEEF